MSWIIPIGPSPFRDITLPEPTRWPWPQPQDDGRIAALEARLAAAEARIAQLERKSKRKHPHGGGPL
jgi:hypothetical protein